MGEGHLSHGPFSFHSRSKVLIVNVRSASPRRRAVHATLIAAVLAVLGAVAPALPALAAEADDVNWTVRTASNDFGADRTNFSYTIDPGSTISDALVVANHGQTPVDLTVYASDGFTSADGQLSLLVAGEQSHAIGTWVAPGAGAVTVAAGETATIPFSVSVPANATPGDYAGGIVTSLTVPDAASGVNVDRRLGIRVNLRVGGEIAPALALEDMSVSWQGGLNPFAGGDATVVYTLHNSGNATISAQPNAHLSGIFGMFPVDGAGDTDVRQLLPGERAVHTVTIAGVPPLFALLASTTITPLVMDAAGSLSPIAEVSANAVGPAVPWTLLVILALIVVGAALLRTRRLRVRATEQQKVDARVEAAVAVALEAREKAAANTER